MAGYIVRRILTGLVMIFALTVITYRVFATVPADPGIYLTGLRTTPAQLKAQIAFCNSQLGTGYFPEEEEHIAAYLDLQYYKFKR